MAEEGTVRKAGGSRKVVGRIVECCSSAFHIAGRRGRVPDTDRMVGGALQKHHGYRS